MVTYSDQLSSKCDLLQLVLTFFRIMSIISLVLKRKCFKFGEKCVGSASNLISAYCNNLLVNTGIIR